MNVAFFLVAITMTLIALSIVSFPLSKTRVTLNRGNVRLSLLAVVVVVLAAIALYAVLGRPGMVPAPSEHAIGTSADSAAATGAAPGKSAGSVASLVTGLEERLRTEPEDGKGWLLLAKSYDHLGRLEDARDAYGTAVRLGASDDVLAAKLLSTESVAAPGPQVRGNVQLADSLKGKVAPTATVFVIARAVDEQPMPLAVLKRAAGDLPFEFSLSDANAMMQGRGISSVSEIRVVAKISSSGDALASDPGMEVVSEPVSVENPSPVMLVIGRAADPESGRNSGVQQ